MADYKLTCRDCGHATPEDDYYIQCPKCDGFLDVTLAEVPAKPCDDGYASIFRYHRAMPYDPVANLEILAQENIETTPILLAERLSEQLGIELYFKDEMVLPSGTWKDREGFVSIHRLAKAGVEDLFVFSSGNTGTSLARSASIVRGPRLHLVVPEASRTRLQTYRNFFDPDYVKVEFFDGSNDECIEYAKRASAERGIRAEGGFCNYARREGLKLLGLELILDWGQPYDWYVQAIAGGIGVYSLHKAYADLGRAGECPRILGVQPEICAPMVNAWRDGAAELEEKYVPREVVPSDFVRVLRTRNPNDAYPILKPIMDEVGGRFEDASDAEIYDGLRGLCLDDYYRDLYRERGLKPGLEPATALAGVLKGVRAGYIEKGASVVLNISGAAKEGDLKPQWIEDLLA